MFARRELRHHAAIGLVRGDLRRHALDSSFAPDCTTAAAVSSQELSIPRMFTGRGCSPARVFSQEARIKFNEITISHAKQEPFGSCLVSENVEVTTQDAAAARRVNGFCITST